MSRCVSKDLIEISLNKYPSRPTTLLQTLTKPFFREEKRNMTG